MVCIGFSVKDVSAVIVSMSVRGNIPSRNCVRFCIKLSDNLSTVGSNKVHLKYTCDQLEYVGL